MGVPRNVRVGGNENMYGMSREGRGRSREGRKRNRKKAVAGTNAPRLDQMLVCRI